MQHACMQTTTSLSLPKCVQPPHGSTDTLECSKSSGIHNTAKKLYVSSLKAPCNTTNMNGRRRTKAPQSYYSNAQ